MVKNKFKPYIVRVKKKHVPCSVASMLHLDFVRALGKGYALVQSCSREAIIVRPNKQLIKDYIENEFDMSFKDWSKTINEKL